MPNKLLYEVGFKAVSYKNIEHKAKAKTLNKTFIYKVY